MKAKLSKELIYSQIVLCLFSIQLFTFSSNACAANGSGGVIGGGGGDTILNKTTGETISIADPIALLRPQGKRIQIPQTVRDELTKIRRIAEGYFFLETKFDSLTSDLHVDYRLIEEIPNIEACKNRIKYMETENANVTISQAACTYGSKTWLKKSSYEELLKMSSKRELALLLVHEGLRRIPNISDEDLISITNGLRFVMSVFDNQSIEKMAKIDEDGKNIINSMLESILLNGLSKNGDSMSMNKSELDKYEVSEYGGLIGKNSQADESARIGIGSYIDGFNFLKGDKIKIGANVTLIGTIYRGIRYDRVCLYNKNCNIDNAPLTTEIPENVSLINSRIEANRLGAISKDSVIVNSTINTSYALGPNAHIINSDVVIIDTNRTNEGIEAIGQNAFIVNSSVDIYKVLGSNARIENSKVEGLNAGDNLKITSSLIIPQIIDGEYKASIKFGNNITVENSNIHYNYTFMREAKFPNNLTLKNITKVTFTNAPIDSDQLPFFSFQRGKTSKLEFQEGSNLDFKGKQICNNGSEDKFQSGMARVKIKSLEELVQYCAK